jgi:hypothetical protein
MNPTGKGPCRGGAPLARFDKYPEINENPRDDLDSEIDPFCGVAWNPSFYDDHRP